jgi:hypothetical protein
VFEEQDKLLAKRLVKFNFRGIVERWNKSYITSGRDLDTLITLFKLSGCIDGLLIEQNEMVVTSILSKV